EIPGLAQSHLLQRSIPTDAMKHERALGSAIGTGEYSPYPAQRLRLVYARDDAAGSSETPATAARLLVVEDDFLLATEAEMTLRDAGFDVVEVVSSAEDARKAAASEAFTLVVKDIRVANRMD